MKNIGTACMVFLFTVLLIAKPANAQWTQTGPYGGTVYALAASGRLSLPEFLAPVFFFH